MYERIHHENEGSPADYIHQLRDVDPDLFGIAIQTIDGQEFQIGDCEVPFCIQSSCGPINYCMAVEELGENEVHRLIG